ncbi:hypothetical protein BC628DRAFT_425041, partial [Trametes gibbosa]
MRGFPRRRRCSRTRRSCSTRWVRCCRTTWTRARRRGPGREWRPQGRRGRTWWAVRVANMAAVSTREATMSGSVQNLSRSHRLHAVGYLRWYATLAPCSTSRGDGVSSAGFRPCAVTVALPPDIRQRLLSWRLDSCARYKGADLHDNASKCFIL